MFPDPLRPSPPLKQLKVSLPMDLHLRLHQWKVLRGVPIQEVVAEALRLYFHDIEAARPPSEEDFRPAWSPTLLSRIPPDPEPRTPALVRPR